MTDKKYEGLPEELINKALKDEGEEAETLTEMLTIRQRLVRRLEKQTVDVPFKDDLGEFNITIRLLSPSEQNELSTLRIKLMALLNRMNKVISAGNVDSKKISVLNDESQKRLKDLYMFVAKICVNPELNAEYWSKGEGFSIDVPLKLINEASSASQNLSVDVERFRKE